jgi:hypothetical protein
VRCGRLEDLDARVPVARALDASRVLRFAPRLASVTVLGLCAACAARGS